MANSLITVRPMLRGPLAASGPWQALIARPNKRIYPFTAGATVDTASTGTTIQMGGLGTIAASDYIIVCNKTAYGNVSLFIPDMSKIRLVNSVSGSDDDIVVDAAVVVAVGDHILTIGADGASTPKVTPDLDAIEALFDDPYVATANSNGYLLTGDGGQFQGFLGLAVRLVDLLITDNSKNAEIVIPYHAIHPGVPVS